MNQIKFIKNEYLNPTPILYLCRGVPESPLRTRDYNTAINIVKSDKQNEVSTLTFEIPFSKDRKITIDDNGKLVLFENRYYIINDIETDDGDTPNIKVSCESEDTELKGIYCETIDKIGVSPYDMYDAIMKAVKHPIDLSKNYKWAGTDVVNKFRHLQTQDEQSVYQNLVSMAEVFNGWLEITTDEQGQNWIFLRTQDIDDGKFIKKNLEMKTLNITSDSKEIFTQVAVFGKADELTGEELNIMSVNPNGNKSYLESYSWYLSKGIPTSNIDNEPKYQQFKIIRDDKYVDANDLYQMGVEELAKCSIPKINASLSLSDLSIYIDSPIEPPKIGHKLLCIDSDIDFIFSCRIVGVERPYNNPADVKIDISNINRYDTTQQNIQHTVENVNQVISTNPTNVDGNNTGDGKPNIPMNKVCDGDHINVVYRLNETKSLITETGNLISLRVDEQNKSFAELKITADAITSHVQDISDTNHQVYSEIQQTARNIKAIVVEDADSGEVELDKDKFVVAFNGSTNRKAIIDRNDGLYLGNPDTGTYSKVGYNGRLELMMAGETQPYHCLMDGGTIDITCMDTSSGYTPISIKLPNKFSGIPDSQIKAICGVKKVYDTNIDSYSNLPFWFGGYCDIQDGRLNFEAMSKWRRVEYEDDSNGDSWVKDIRGEYNGKIILEYVIIA